ncbi:hypothetical protein B0T18DRAFT_464811, partial [Schizothecium vesticola]
YQRPPLPNRPLLSRATTPGHCPHPSSLPKRSTPFAGTVRPLGCCPRRCADQSPKQLRHSPAHGARTRTHLTALSTMAAPNKNTCPTRAEGSHAPTRSPRYNNVNQSQAQRAGTSSASGRNPFASGTTGGFAPGTNGASSDEDRRTYSNGEASSNTNASAYTMAGGPGPAPVWPATPATPATLTMSALGTHQMHMGSFQPVHGWLAQPGPQDRLVRLAVPSRASSSVFAVGDANSRQSTAGSSISLEYQPAPPPRTMTNDIREVGAWCRRLERKK